MIHHETVASTRIVVAVAVIAGAGTTGLGAWAYASPAGFAEFAGFPEHTHFVHDLAAFQIGVGLTVLLALIWSDALATALAGFLVTNTLHTVNHAVDLDLGGRAWQAWGLAVLSLALVVALGLRLRTLGYVVGSVRAATTPALRPYVRQKTITLTTFRRDGRPGTTPVSIAVDGDHAYVRSFEASMKTKRLRRDPNAEITPSSGRGRPTGSPIPARLRRLDGDEDRHAARLLRRKHPFLHGVVVPLTHRLGRAKFGKTVHFVATPIVDREALRTTRSG
ncbi:MAG TPA: PPOX class F420-dependent oxidoreductase [Nocardioidaceae bacterium]|nr:PPOX class F420-dependent oxidoreductase [Nocardioidaceae bacterium]